MAKLIGIQELVEGDVAVVVEFKDGGKVRNPDGTVSFAITTEVLAVYELDRTGRRWGDRIDDEG